MERASNSQILRNSVPVRSVESANRGILMTVSAQLESASALRKTFAIIRESLGGAWPEEAGEGAPVAADVASGLEAVTRVLDDCQGHAQAILGILGIAKS